MSMVVSIKYSKLVDVTERMCDNYCKWPNKARSDAELEDICEGCPLNTILHDEEEDANRPD